MIRRLVLMAGVLLLCAAPVVVAQETCYDTCNAWVCDNEQTWVDEYCESCSPVCETGWNWVEDQCQSCNWTCDTGYSWVDEYCDSCNEVCDTCTDCWEECDEWGCWTNCSSYACNCRTECSSYVCGGHWEAYEYNCRNECQTYGCNGRWEEYQYNCHDECSSYVCGGHWETAQTNCRWEQETCNPHPCDPPPPSCGCAGQNPYEDADGDCIAGPPFGDDCHDGDCSIGGGCAVCDNNSVCEFSENSDNCPNDCSSAPPPPPPPCSPTAESPAACCGNSHCDAGEATVCPDDCGASSSDEEETAALCPGDSWVRRYSLATPITQCKIEIRTVSILEHTASHPNCGSRGDDTPIGAKASMATGLFGSCTAEDGGFHSGIIAAIKDCDNLPGRLYTNRGTHLYDGRQDGTSSDEAQIQGCASDDVCAGNGCTPGYTRDTTLCNENVVDQCGCCENATPIVIDMNGDGLRFSSAEAGVLFDVNGLGEPIWLGWPESPDDAWLALDRNDNGRIDSGLELFGNTRRLSSGIFAPNGYEALRDLDLNADGLIDARDPVYSRLVVWGDANRNGLSEPRELRTLEAAGVLALSLDYRDSRRQDRWGNAFRYRAKVRIIAQQHDRTPADRSKSKKRRADKANPTEWRDSWDVYPASAPAVLAPAEHEPEPHENRRKLRTR